MLWYAMHGYRPSRAAWIADRLVKLGWIGLLVVAVSWFAGPAFRELAGSGYGVGTDSPVLPEVHPFTRILFNRLNLGTPLSPAPGQARLEFNIALRQFSALLAPLCAFGIVAAASRSIIEERKRDTWSGLIATPLSGWEILRAKMLGAAWYARGYAATMLVLWAVGLLAGALHPLGFLAGLVALAVSIAFFAAMGVSLSLGESGRSEPRYPTAWRLRALAIFGWLILLPIGPILFTTASLLSYEDLQSAAITGAFLPWSGWSGWRPIPARLVVAAWLITTSALAAGTLLLVRTLCRQFDVAVGRPTG